jgi:hypothetical protein
MGTKVTLSAEELRDICNAMDCYSSEQFPYTKLRKKLEKAGARAYGNEEANNRRKRKKEKLE